MTPNSDLATPTLRPEVCPHCRDWWTCYWCAQDDARGSRRVVVCRACGLELNGLRIDTVRPC